MKITITRRELKSMTTGFSKIVPNRGTLQVLSCVCFSNTSGKVTAEATDLDQTAVYSLDNSAAEGEGVMLVPLALLRSLSKGTDREIVALESADDKITVTNHVGGHAVTQTIEALDPEDWPPAGGAIRTSPASGFISAYRDLSVFASTDSTRQALCSVFIDTREAKGEEALVATDGRRLTLRGNLDIPIRDKEGVIVPISKFLLWNGLPEDAEIGVSKGKDNKRFCARSGPWTYRTKVYDGVYPNYKQVMPSTDSAANKLIFTDDEVNALTKIIPAFPGDMEYITFKCSAGEEICLQGKDHMGEKDLLIPLTSGSTYEGAGCNICINRDSLLDALKAGFREFMFADNASPLLSVDSNGGKHVLMPLRLNGPSKPAETAENTSESTEVAKQSTTTPVAEHPQPEPIVNTTTPKEKERHTMPKEVKTTSTNNESVEVTSLEKMLVAYDTLKSKVRESQTAMSDMAPIIRAALKEDRNRRKEVASVRAGLQKLQSIQV